MKERATAQIFLDGRQAESALEGLKKRSEDLRAAIIDAGKAGDHVTMKKLQSELKGVESAQKSLKKESFDVQNVLDNMNGSSFNEISKALGKANRELKAMKQTDPGWEEQKAKVLALRDAQKSLGKEMGTANSFMAKMKNNFSSIPGPIGGAINSTMGLGKALMTLALNPVGAIITAIVGAVYLLVKAFKSTDDGATKLAGIMKGLGNLFDIVLDRVETFRQGLGKLLKFDFKGFKDKSKEAFSGAAQSIKEAVDAGIDYENTMDAIKDREAASLTRSAKLRAEIENLKNASKDVTKSAKERIEASEQAIAKEIELNGIEKQFMQERTQAEMNNLAAKMQMQGKTIEERAAILSQWLQYDDREVLSMREKNKAFGDFYNKNEEAFHELQRMKADEFTKDSELATKTREMQSGLSSLRKQLNDEAANARQEQQKKELEVLAAQQEKELLEVKKSMLEQGANKEAIDKAIEAKELEHIQALIDLRKKHGEDTTALEMKIVDARIQRGEEAANAEMEQKKAQKEEQFKQLDGDLQKELFKIKQNAREQQATDEETKLQLIAKEIEFIAKKIDLHRQYGDNTEELEQQLIDKTFEAAEITLQAENNKLNEVAELRRKYADEETIRQQDMANELAELDKAWQMGAIDSWEQYQQKKNEITSKYEADRIGIVTKYLDAADKLLDTFGNMYAAQKDAELAKAGENEAEKDKINRKYAKKEQGIATGKALISGALAIMKIWQGDITGNPAIDAIIKGIMTAAMVATTAAQVKAINAPQFRTGGFTGSSINDSKPAGIVHANEWVASAPLLRNPETRKYIDHLEWVQRGIKPLRFNDASIKKSAKNGYQSGGFVSEATISPKGAESNEASNKELIDTIAMMSAAANRLAEKEITVNAREVFNVNEKYEAAIRASEY